MRQYIKSSRATQLSNALWGLVRPDSVRTEEDTQYLFGWITDVHGDGWLEADDERMIQIHAEANLDKLNALMQGWIDEGILTNADRTALHDTVMAHKASGEPLPVFQSFPQYFKDAAKDRPTMFAEGYISSEPNLPMPLAAARKR